MVRRATRSIESLKRKTGTKMMIANDSVNSGKFEIVLLCSNHTHVSVDHNSLIEKLLHAMKDRLFATTASGTVRASAAYQKLLDQVSVLYPTYWPQDVDFNYGVEEIRSLCDRFALARSVIIIIMIFNQGAHIFEEFFNGALRVSIPRLCSQSRKTSS